MKIPVVGAGATGGYFGARPALAGRDVTFLVRRARARVRGLRIVEPDGVTTVEPPLVEAGGITGSYDLVLLWAKATALASAIEHFAPAAGPDTLVLPVLNGMAHLDVLAERFGEAGCSSPRSGR
jgi:2-dehydropantoate 2-reductase